MRPRAEVLDLCQVVGPQVVDRAHRDAALPLGQVAFEDLLTIGLDLVRLAPDRKLLRVQERAGIQMLSFHQPLQ